jgi:hypothetical protein
VHHLPRYGADEHHRTPPTCGEIAIAAGNAAMSTRENRTPPRPDRQRAKHRPALVAPIVATLGHEVIARKIEVADVGAVPARKRPDVEDWQSSIDILLPEAPAS